MNRLTLSEYQGATLGKRWNPEEKVISRYELALINRLQKDTRCKLFNLGYSSIKATSWVGVMGLENKYLEVVPKVDRGMDDNCARENLHYMISRAGLVPLAPADLIEENRSQKPLLHAYMELYVDRLSLEWRRGPIKRYVVQEENRTFLKGKLLIQEHLKQNSIHKERFYTACDEFTEDNILSQLLKAALRICASQSFSLGLSKKANSLMPDFENVCDGKFSSQELSAIYVDRQIKRFEPLINLAKLIINETSPYSKDTGGKVYSLMFDMNVVFEKFLASELRRALKGTGLSVRYQVSGKSLVEKDGYGKFSLRPDFGVYKERQLLCLLDTKWKVLDQDKSHASVSQADMYQMYAYGKEYQSPKTILLYPRRQGQHLEIAKYQHRSETAEMVPEIHVCTVDVSSPMMQPANSAQIKQDLLKILNIPF